MGEFPRSDARTQVLRRSLPRSGLSPPPPLQHRAPPVSPGAGTKTTPPFKEVLEPGTKSKSKPLTQAQKLAKALKACKHDRAKRKRDACEGSARKKYSPANR